MVAGIGGLGGGGFGRGGVCGNARVVQGLDGALAVLLQVVCGGDAGGEGAAGVVEAEGREALRLVGGVDVDVAEVDVCTGFSCLVDLEVHLGVKGDWRECTLMAWGSSYGIPYA